MHGLVKPDIVFFGEPLPPRFFDLSLEDFKKCDLLLVLGTSLQVQPFASLIRKVSSKTPRVLINMQEVAVAPEFSPDYSGGFTFNYPANVRDVKWIGDCQDGIAKLCELLGWTEHLETLKKSTPVPLEDMATNKI